MQLSTHRIKSQEKKLVKRILFTIATIAALFMLSLYVGLPLLAKIIVTFSSGNSDKTTTNATDSIILLPPILNPLAEATNSARVKISGFTKPDTTVEITLNDTDTYKITPDKDGAFNSKIITLKDGENTVSAVSLFKNQISDPAPTLTILYKKKGPELLIDSPKDGETISTDSDTTNIVGQTDPDTKVTINDRLVITNQNGRFSFSVKLSNGDNEYKIVALDQAGNKTEQELRFKYSP
jgi:hypothetical protein